MTTETAEMKVWFYEGVCCEEENRKALELLRNAGIPLATIMVKQLEDFPHVEWGYARYERLKGIARFVEKWKKGDIPPPLLPKNKRGGMRENRIDQAVALAQVIRQKDPELKHAFIPEVAEKILEERRWHAKMANNKGMVIFRKTLSIGIMLPEDHDPDDIKKKIEEELHIDTGNLFLPIMYTKEAGGNIDFGSYGRRWCIRVTIDASEEEDFLKRLRCFCEKYNIVLNEKGTDPFEGRHPIFEK